MNDYPKTGRNTVKRIPKRGSYDRETIYAILDEAFLCHAGFVIEGQPFVIPTLYARDGDTIYIHGSAISRMLTAMSEGVRVCIAVTLTDGIVLARSAFHHSVNYRSIIAYGTGRAVVDDAEKLAALEMISENVVPGRWEDARTPTKRELDATTVISIAVEEASAKVRELDPIDDKDDYGLPIWAGVIPFVGNYGPPIADSRLDNGIPVPEYIRRLLKNDQASSDK